MRLASAILSIIVVATLFWLGIVPEKTYDNSDFGIQTYYSKNDQDNDGIDDQTDILQSARAYLVKKPRYASKYYANGYPDDDYGVCTDVVAFALKDAGYDLRELVDWDIQHNPEKYDVEIADKNIDFRRVDNLVVWFQNHTTSLTSDIKKIQEWQGGDIVIFQDHIGIISDRRNHKGIPYLIHHYSPLQSSYEENSLERHAAEIVGHFRV